RKPMPFEPCADVRLTWVDTDMVVLNIVGGEYYCLPDFADVASPLDVSVSTSAMRRRRLN
ncbi:hypothetical protein, partial [Myxococcus sp. CA006]|uniref:hypothetical protein n=1 Tax=Myxococcus sp. CA006 TaxID=2562799 RepID=UPI001E41C271